MPSTTTDGHILNVLQAGLEYQVKAKITETIVKESVEEYERKVRAILDDVLKDFTVGKIEKLRNFQELRDEIHVVVHHKESD